MSRSVLQDWVMDLGLRHQGVLLAAVRGCDTLPKHAASKTMSRYYRGTIMVAFGEIDPRKAPSFMSLPESSDEFRDTLAKFFDEHDALPFHYVLHLMHASEIVGYYRDDWMGALWKEFYERLCRRMHIQPETKEQLDARLNADDKTFKAAQGQ